MVKRVQEGVRVTEKVCQVCVSIILAKKNLSDMSMGMEVPSMPPPDLVFVFTTPGFLHFF